MQPTYKPTNMYKKIQHICTEIQSVNNIETFSLKSATEDASLISRGRRFHYLTILFIKLNLKLAIVTFIWSFLLLEGFALSLKV